MDLSDEEQATLATMETALRAEEPELARTLATFTRPRRFRWRWVMLVGLLMLSPLSLILGIALHSMTLNVLGAVLVGALLVTSAVLSWDAS